ncbi:Pentatricopeptide repeat-containing protein [Platanthera guangdongensis]|uniref:Pentatricopeptide repeat-containing protein n=1 Tax=Platanthera guangdongensis TaxID=2320717 RepID=A0ABR2MXG7_9ASPA
MLSLRYFSSIAGLAASSMKTSHVNILITRLSRQGRICEARRLFDETSQPDLTSWTALIAAYSREGQLREAELLFNRSDALRDVVTWTALLSGHVRAGHLREAENLFDRMPEKNVVSWNTMVSAYAENRMVDKAFEVFDKMPVRNIVSWNTIISAMAQSGRIEDACRFFFQMPKRNVVSWTAVVSGLSKNGRVDQARELFDKMPVRNVVSWNAMISGYTLNQRIEEALPLFKAMPERNTASWNTMITGFIQNKELKTALKLFDEMPVRNVVTWTTLMTGYVREGQHELALQSFSDMLADRVRPNDGTFVTILAAISSLAALTEGLQVHQIIRKTRFQFSPHVESCLMSMYSKCGDITTARKLFDATTLKDLVNWNGMVTSYAHHGCGQDAILLFDKMRRRGIKPNDVTYIALLSACSHSGLVEEGLKIFESLTKDGSTDLRVDHYSCLVDLFSRAGLLDLIKELISGLNIEKFSTFSWGALLDGCYYHKNANLGKLAAMELLKTDYFNSRYMLVSNIYTSNDKWKEAAKNRSMIAERELKKQPGCSWIEIGNQVHVFLAQDRLHANFDSIDCMLRELHHEMKMMRYSSSI